VQPSERNLFRFGKVSYAAQMLAGMETGWNQSLDRLADLVAKS
jgi:uncharacterized protein YndB with AHSA1/START domain